ncbi:MULTISPECIES: DEAD/DEAH box helicase family protein [unclassified Synechococcus]|uniref:DEAD/DEAH box helicase family protein n=1 Tax=unclassified Synechococcus TaxID=2626047 RepID=UPI0008FF2481
MLRDGSFGELLVDGQRPGQWRHVFASVQSLAAMDPAGLAPGTFDVVIVDEFHHAAASSYERWLAHLAPSLLLGLTATPERSDGLDILHWFGGHTAAELRLAPPRRHRPLADRMAPQRLCQRGAHQPLHRRRRPPAPDPARTREQDHQPAHDAGPGLLRERGARRLDGPQVRRCRPARRLLRCLELPRRARRADPPPQVW